ARRRRSASPSCSTTRTAPGPRAIGSWRWRYSTMHRKELGRGLEALIPGASATAVAEPRDSDVHLLLIDDVGPNPYQPRGRFDAEALNELAASIRSSGVLQPVLVRK